MEKESDDDLNLQVVVENNAIIVTLPGTQYCLSYRRKSDAPWVVCSDISYDPASPISKFTFRAQAFIAANEKARELGWIV